MGYTHYMRASEGFHPEELEEFSCLAAEITAAWFKKHPEVRIDPEYSNAGLKEAIESGESVDEKLSRIFWEEGVCIHVAGGCENIVIPREGEDFFFCKTARIESYDALCVAIFVLAEYVSGGKLRFSSDGDLDEIQPGLDLLREVLNVDYLPLSYTFRSRFDIRDPYLTMDGVLTFGSDMIQAGEGSFAFREGTRILKNVYESKQYTLPDSIQSVLSDLVDFLKAHPHFQVKVISGELYR